MASTPATNVTRLLLEWRGGNQRALDLLMPRVYDELRRLAQHYLKAERRDHTLQATALVNEAYLRLVDVNVPWQDRVHFFAVAARLMRRLLVDHARARHRAKRDGGPRISLADAERVAVAPQTDVLLLDEALVRLAEFDSRKADIVELHFFGGLGNEDVAEALGISRATVQRELRMAKAWLARELQ